MIFSEKYGKISKVFFREKKNAKRLTSFQKNKNFFEVLLENLFSMQAKNLFLASKQNKENDFTTEWFKWG